MKTKHNHRLSTCTLYISDLFKITAHASKATGVQNRGQVSDMSTLPVKIPEEMCEKCESVFLFDAPELTTVRLLTGATAASRMLEGSEAKYKVLPTNGLSSGT